MAITFPERVAERAQTVHVVKLLLSLLAFPFWLLGVVCGVLWLVVSWTYAAAVLGFSDVRDRRGGD